jgi:hypothetical protein
LEGDGTSCGDAEANFNPPPPPIPPTLVDAIVALVNATVDNARVLRELAHHQNNQAEVRIPQNQQRNATYMEFMETRPQVFAKAKERLEANEWLHVIEQKFGFIQCTEVQKSLFAAQQLCGAASTWWSNFVAIQPPDHQVTWAEFKESFQAHHIPHGILQMKLEECLRLRQGVDIVIQYIGKFNHVSHYAVEHVNTDIKKRDCFMRGLNSKLQKKMATCYDLTFNRAISVAIVVEDKARVHQNVRRVWKGSGSGFSQVSAKCQKVVIRTTGPVNAPYHPPAYPFKNPIYILPTNMPNQLPPTNIQVPRMPAPTGSKYPCYNYGKVGHFIKDYPYPRQNNSNFPKSVENNSRS